MQSSLLFLFMLLFLIIVGSHGEEVCETPVLLAAADSCAGRCYRRVAVAALMYRNGEYTFRLSRNGFPDTNASRTKTTTNKYMRVTFSLLSGYEYRVEFLRNGQRIPKWFDYLYTDNDDQNVCSGGVSLVLPNEDGMVHTIFAAHKHTKTFPVPCPGVAITFPSNAPQYFDRCVGGASERVLILPPGRMYEEFGSITKSINVHVANEPMTACVHPDYNMCSLVEHEGIWKYSTSFTGSNFQNSSLDDSSWASGPSPFGYGVTGINTLIPIEISPTAYFRKNFNLSNQSCFLDAHLDAKMRFDDGFVLYVNGFELYRKNIVDGPITMNTLAKLTSRLRPRFALTHLMGNSAVLNQGENLIAIEVHRKELLPLFSTMSIELYLMVAHKSEC